MLKATTAADAITEATLRVLETAAFMTIWVWQESDAGSAPFDRAATMTFSGSHSGRISLKISGAVLPQLVQNMMGECDDSGAAARQSDDAMCESLNMICGNVLTEWYGEEPVFELHPPRAVTLAEVDALHDARAIVVTFCLEHSRCDVLAELN
jgi:CheY-specific phosphatase CheX